MKRSTERLLTTHVGSLARPHELLELMKAVVAGEPYDIDAFAYLARHAVIEVVRQQADCGVDVVSDGEQSKAGEGPRVHDVPLGDIVHLLLRIDAGAQG